jgi:RHS repeat-associated protein
MWDGGYQWSETQYDALGRVFKQYMPCSTASATSSCRLHAVTNSYDALNRLTQSSRPRSQSDTSPQSTTYAYAGGMQTTTDPLGKVSARIVNVDGSARQIKDGNNYAINFANDAAGSVVGVTDSENATRFSGVNVHYGVQAFQVAATDSALGQQTRAFNSLGEMIAWTNGNNHSFSATYDPLSRPLTRVGPNSSTTWVWGSNSAAYNKGRLQHVESTESGETYAEDYTYDSRTRPLSRSISIPGQGSFNYDYAYDATKGWLDTLTYPVSTSGYRLALKYAYQNGILQSVSNANAPTTVFWTANNSNAWGQLTQDTLGNGVVRVRAFDAVTARLSSIQSGVSGNPTSVQNLSFLYDLVGNVTQRQNNKLGLTETFYYGGGGDNLYRLDHSTLYDGSTSLTNLALTYDKSGNILTKNEAGFTEPLVNQTVTWTSYDYPAQIVSGAETASFAYGPDRQRWRMIYTGSLGAETTYYIGGLLEKVIVGGNASFRHTITAAGSAMAMYTMSNGGATVLNYVLDDHLGSAESFANNDAGTVVNASFSAFGMRRNAVTWSGDEPNRTALDAITRQGYTFHTMLGSTGFNHMNGRVQDALNGRFLSADPFIDGVMNTQGWNRYAYVKNNPLSSIDPTGFIEVSDTVVVNGTRGALFEWQRELTLAGMLDRIMADLIGSIPGGQSPGDGQTDESDSDEADLPPCAAIEPGTGDATLTAAEAAAGSARAGTIGTSADLPSSGRSALDPVTKGRIGGMESVVANIHWERTAKVLGRGTLALGAYAVVDGWRTSTQQGIYASTDFAVGLGLGRLGWGGVAGAVGYSLVGGSEGIHNVIKNAASSCENPSP